MANLEDLSEFQELRVVSSTNLESPPDMIPDGERVFIAVKSTKRRASDLQEFSKRLSTRSSMVKEASNTTEMGWQTTSSKSEVTVMLMIE